MLRRQGFQPNIPSGPEHENRLRFFEHHLPTGHPRRKSGMAFMGVNIREPKKTFLLGGGENGSSKSMLLGYDFEGRNLGGACQNVLLEKMLRRSQIGLVFQNKLLH